MKTVLYGLISLIFLCTNAWCEIPATSEQQIIGTQATGNTYHFTQENNIIEQAKRIQEMGSHIIKISAKRARS